MPVSGLPRAPQSSFQRPPGKGVSCTGTATSLATCPRPRSGRSRPCSRRSTLARSLAAREKAIRVIEKLRGLRLSRAAELVEMAVEETLTYYAFPEEHWRRIRTNNPLERILREIRRRTRVVGAFPDGPSALNLAAARLRHIVGTAWSTKRYLNIELLKDQQMRDAITACARLGRRLANRKCERGWRFGGAMQGFKTVQCRRPPANFPILGPKEQPYSVCKHKSLASPRWSWIVAMRPRSLGCMAKLLDACHPVDASGLGRTQAIPSQCPDWHQGIDIRGDKAKFRLS